MTHPDSALERGGTNLKLPLIPSAGQGPGEPIPDRRVPAQRLAGFLALIEGLLALIEGWLALADGLLVLTWS